MCCALVRIASVWPGCPHGGLAVVSLGLGQGYSVREQRAAMGVVWRRKRGVWQHGLGLVVGLWG